MNDLTLPDLGDYITMKEAALTIGCNYRAIQRAINRAGIDEVTITFLGRRLVRIDKLDVIKAHYYPYYSDAHQAMVKEWGRRGGSTKAANRKKRQSKKKPARSSSSDTTGTGA